MSLRNESFREGETLAEVAAEAELNAGESAPEELTDRTAGDRFLDPCGGRTGDGESI